MDVVSRLFIVLTPHLYIYMFTEGYFLEAQGHVPTSVIKFQIEWSSMIVQSFVTFVTDVTICDVTYPFVITQMPSFLEVATYWSQIIFLYLV